MPLALCRNQYNGFRSTSQRNMQEKTWADHLPKDWKALVVSPLAFDVFRDYEADAERTVGRDEDGTACYHAHRYVLRETRSDDDEEFYEVVAYREELAAWRLRDGRWLAWRLVAAEEMGGRAFFSIGQEPPTSVAPTSSPGPCIAYSQTYL